MSYLAMASQQRITRWIYSYFLPVSTFIVAILLLERTASSREVTMINFYRNDFLSVAVHDEAVREKHLQLASPDTVVTILAPGMSSPNILPKKDRYCLLINHILPEVGNFQSIPTYISLKIVFLDEVRSNTPDSVTLFRNHSSDTPWEMRGSGWKPVDGVQVTPSISIEDFLNAHSFDNLDEADRVIGYEWHSSTSASQYSWDNRDFWRGKPEYRNYNSNEFYQVAKLKVNPFHWLIGNSITSALLGVLISYRPASHQLNPLEIVKSTKKVIYCFNRHQAIAAYMKVLTPIPSRQDEFIMIFDKDNTLLKI